MGLTGFYLFGESVNITLKLPVEDMLQVLFFMNGAEDILSVLELELLAKVF